MTQVKLKRILSIKRKAASLVNDIIRNSKMPIAVWDMEANLLLGDADMDFDEVPDKHPVHCEGEIIGWASGGEQASVIASLLTLLAGKEAENAALSDEVLNLYRQINLLYKLSGKLATSLELATVARLTLEEASRLINASGSSVLLFNEQTDAHESVVTLGQGIQAQANLKPDDGILGAVASSAKAEIINDAQSDARYRKSDTVCNQNQHCAVLTNAGDH